MSNKTLFLDRDGVINNIDQGFVNTIDDFVFCDGALEAILLLNQYFDHTIVVTNQAGIGYGYMTRATLESIHEHMAAEVQFAGGTIDRVYYCPDRVSKAAQCRKPNSGMALQAQRDFPTIDFERSWMVGDRDSDIEFGQRLNMQTVRIVNHHMNESVDSEIQAHQYVSSLLEFSLWIAENWNQ